MEKDQIDFIIYNLMRFYIYFVICLKRRIDGKGYAEEDIDGSSRIDPKRYNLYEDLAKDRWNGETEFM